MSVDFTLSVATLESAQTLTLEPQVYTVSDFSWSGSSSVIVTQPTIEPFPLTVIDTPVTGIQLVEPNDTILSAIDTGLNSNNPGTYTLNAFIGDNLNVSSGLDVDFFQVQLNAGDRLAIDIDVPYNYNYYDPQLYSALRLFDGNGNQLTYNSSSSAPGESYNYLESYIDFTASTAGSYYIGVSSSNNTSYNPLVEGSGSYYSYNTGSYTINIDLIPPTTINGTAEDDTLTGTNRVDIISGLAGDDEISGLDNADQIFGGSGNDFIYGGNGNDVIQGDEGNDSIYGESGNDTLYGGLGNDSLIGYEGNDVAYGGDGRDTITGGWGEDHLYGGAAADKVFGDSGNDTLYGEDGNDTLSGGEGYDQLYGGKGSDNLFGNENDDSLYGQDGNDILTGGSGYDVLEGGKGNDRLVGVEALTGWGTGETDTLIGGAGKDTFVLGDKIRSYYEDGSYLSSGELDYALITDFNQSQDIIQLHGSSEFYRLDFYTSGVGNLDAVLTYDVGDLTRGEVIGIIQNVSSNLNITDSSFTFV